MSTQSEAQMENSLLQTLETSGYERVEVKNEESLLENLKIQLEILNDTKLNDDEFKQILNFLSGGSTFEKAKKLRDRFPLLLKDGSTKHIRFLDSVYWCQNIFQVTNQVRQEGFEKNRYDVTILINGFPLVQIELKRRGAELSEAFKQIDRYKIDSFNAGYGLFGYIQMFVISDGENTKYYANNPKPSFGQTFFWADENNKQITQIEAFTEIFLEKCHLSKMICKYTILNTEKIMMILRPYQFYASEKIVDKVKNSNENGYIWHTTGSGKTLTSFKTAQLLSELDKVTKVVFVVDRKDLDTQTKIEFNSFKAGSVDGTDNTKQLVKQFNDDTKLIVTTIQKLNTAISKENYLISMDKLKNEHIVFIFDECHRSQFGETHTKIKRFFKKGQMIGFTGTPIFVKNAVGSEDNKRTTEDLFDTRLHAYLVNDAIADKNVLGFIVDHLATKEEKQLNTQLKDLENKEDKNKETTQEIKDIKKQLKDMLESPQKVESVVDFVIHNHNKKTKNKKFTAMMCVSSVDMLIKYYDTFKSKNHDLKIATIFSYSSKEEDSENIEDGNGANIDEKNIDNTKKDTLQKYINDYNNIFDTSFTTDAKEYYNYYDDIAKRVKNQEIDLLLVVNMFLTGFDSKTLNTLYVDKNLKYHSLIQAFSRTNRILDGKEAGNILCFRDLQDNMNDALTLFSNKNADSKVIRDNYSQYLIRFSDALNELREIAPTPNDVNKLKTDEDKLIFIKAFREVLKYLDVMKTFIEFTYEDIGITEYEINQYKSKYLYIYNEIEEEKSNNDENTPNEDESSLQDIDFKLELITTDIVNLSYILKLLAKLDMDDDEQRTNILNIINATPSLKVKKELIEMFINQYVSKDDDFSDIEEEYIKFIEIQKEIELKDFCTKYELLEDLVIQTISQYLYDNKKIKVDDIEKLFIEEPDIFESEEIIETVRKKIMSLIYKYN